MIESLQNDKIKYLSRLLADNRFRKKEGVFTVEGVQENERALTFQQELVSFYICEKIFNGSFPSQYISISENIYHKLAYRGTSEGIIGIYRTPEINLKNYSPKENASVIVVESVEKPGNLGAILRSCEAFGIDALIITDVRVDLFNPNVIRSSVGCVFGMKVFQSDNMATLDFLKSENFQIYTTHMHQEAKKISNLDLSRKSALIFGTEHSGISEFWKNSGQNTIIPMAGSIDSLNLSNAVAIACYEILRQKKLA